MNHEKNVMEEKKLVMEGYLYTAFLACLIKMRVIKLFYVCVVTRRSNLQNSSACLSIIKHKSYTKATRNVTFFTLSM